MQMQTTESKFRLIFNSTELLIPFHLINNINENIYEEIVTNHQYIVKSNVREEIFQSFLRHLLYKELPNITNENITEYSKLSQEFDHMSDVIKFYKKTYLKLNIPTIENMKNKSMQQIKEKNCEYENKENNYQKIIQFLFENFQINLDSNKKAKLYKSCKKERVNLVYILTRPEITDENGLIYILDEINNEAGVIGMSDLREEIFIPRNIFYDSQKYPVTIIHERAFYKCQNIKRVVFPDDSEMKIIDKCSFTASSLESINIPQKVTRINKYAFNSLINSLKISFSDFSELKIIEEESFSYSSLKEISLPLSLTTIGTRAFGATGLTHVDLSSHINLHSICRSAFSSSLLNSLSLPSSVDDLQRGWYVGLYKLNDLSIKKYEGKENIINFDNKYIIKKSDNKSENFDIIEFSNKDIEEAIIPPFIKQIAFLAFNTCKNLRKVGFSNESKFVSIEKKAFENCPIESLYIPSCILELNDCWCFGLTKLTSITISPKNEQFIFFDDKYLIGKSNLDNQIYDILYFARRDIKTANIPSFITRIESCAFGECINLKNIIFSNDSNLYSIGKYAFYRSSIERISFPQKIIEIDDHAFSDCGYLKAIDFGQNSNLLSIGKLSFSNCPIKSICLPGRLLHFDKIFYYSMFVIYELDDNKWCGILLRNSYLEISLNDNDFVAADTVEDAVKKSNVATVTKIIIKGGMVKKTHFNEIASQDYLTTLIIQDTAKLESYIIDSSLFNSACTFDI